MSRFEDQWSTFELRWRGEINHSALVIAKKTLERKYRYDFINRASYGAYTLIGLWFLFELRKNLPSALYGGFSVDIMMPFVVFLAAVSIFQMLVNVYKSPYQKIKALLKEKTKEEFCDCVSSYWGYSCSKNHKENFMKDVKETFNLNLYY